MKDYAQHSLMTDPGVYRFLFDELPNDLAQIKSVIHGLLLHFSDGDFRGYSIPLARFRELETYCVDKMLALLISRDSKSLLCERSLENKMISSCRDFSLLFCSILRHKRIPARLRCGFNSYFLTDFNHDQMILEYWNSSEKRFCRVDARTTEAHLAFFKIKIDFNLLDAPKEKLMLAAEAWMFCRNNPEQAENFGGGNREKNKGLWYIRDRLIQDIAALNGVETQLWEVWGMMHQSKESIITPKILAFYDHLARMSLDPERYKDSLKECFLKPDFYLGLPREFLFCERGRDD